jgi:hypothetical protein
MQSKKKNRKIIGSKHDVPDKQPRSTSQHQRLIEDTLKQNPAWQLQILDIHHNKWGWGRLKNHHMDDVLSKLKSYESMTWGEIRSDKQRDHSIPIASLSSEAQKRIKELGIEDFCGDELYRLRFKGKQRVWGVVRSHKFYVLWWDPDHTVYPVEKKHT